MLLCRKRKNKQKTGLSTEFKKNNQKNHNNLLCYKNIPMHLLLKIKSGLFWDITGFPGGSNTLA